jgi:hypothetical protein
MKNQILFLVAASLIAAGCVVVDPSTRTQQTSSPYGSADEPFPVLNAYGNWIDVGPYGRVWQPAVMSDWRPYTNGQWVWSDRGWMWDSDEPFGWVVYHYGYWTQMESLGWVWVPGNDWSPARVNWYTENDYIGWAPMAPPQASYPGAYQSGYENYWTVVPAPQFTRLNVGAYRTTPPRQPLPSAGRAKAVERPPDIITIQGATHELIPARKTEQEQVKVGRRTVARVRVAEDDRSAPPAPVLYGSPANPDISRPPSTPAVPPGAGRSTPRPTAPAVVLPPPVQVRTPSPVRVAPAPAPSRVAPTPAPSRVAPAPAPSRVAPTPAPSRVAPEPVAPRVSVPDKPVERREIKREVPPAAKPEVKKEGR